MNDFLETGKILDELKDLNEEESKTVPRMNDTATLLRANNKLSTNKPEMSINRKLLFDQAILRREKKSPTKTLRPSFKDKRAKIISELTYVNRKYAGDSVRTSTKRFDKLYEFLFKEEESSNRLSLIRKPKQNKPFSLKKPKILFKRKSENLPEDVFKTQIRSVNDSKSLSNSLKTPFNKEFYLRKVNLSPENLPSIANNYGKLKIEEILNFDKYVLKPFKF